MELTFGITAVILCILYVIMLVILRDVQTLDYVIFKIFFVLAITLFCVLGGLYFSAIIWIVNLAIQFLLLYMILDD
ncbi:MAG: hypothetical protein UX47_C0006G0028 [Candidatus Collierbacteria bacterium GW2011_GWA2_46_26]|uniref:Uncharacterized protein n=1 Tax=Candidatus Collierbacteria bacterium GW2011_GWA2_46_26 TaxID=1618381 RepID=A0A0G1PK24_9BACT|nr:MAG: hypothetical protein UX47_C0006G0028 [Candidatus Collierbacteria bacterium GW2011_GWA2_46_26]